MNIWKKNQILAEFEGWEETDSEVYLGYMMKDGEQPIHPREMLYHTSWEWLMPVVERIRDNEKMGSLENTIRYLFSRISPTRQTMQFNSIEDLYEAVFQFIEFYNRVKKNVQI